METLSLSLTFKQQQAKIKKQKDSIYLHREGKGRVSVGDEEGDLPFLSFLSYCQSDKIK